MHFISSSLYSCVCEGEGNEECEGRRECSGNGTPLLSEGRGWMSIDIRPDISSMKKTVKGGWMCICACFLFAVGRRGTSAIPSQRSVSWVYLLLRRVDGGDGV